MKFRIGYMSCLVCFYSLSLFASSEIMSEKEFVNMQEQIAHVNDIDIWYETFGKKEDPAVLLLMGGCCQGVIWDKIFCEKLAQEGFYVIRYDHRDTGLSSCFDFEKKPYDIMDMTKDAVGLLDAIKVKKAHLFGVSLGGFITEIMAAYFPERVYSILVMSSSCEIRPMNLAYEGLPPEENSPLPPPSPEYLTWMKEYMTLSPKTEDEKLNQRLDGWNRLNGQKIPLNEETNREIHQAFLARVRHPEAIFNHVLAIRGEYAETLMRTVPAQIKLPTVILHGSEDPIFSPDHGKALTHAIENSQFFLVDGMGHIPNNYFYDFYIDILKKQSKEMNDTRRN